MAELSQEQMLDVVRRTNDEGWLAPLLANPENRAIFLALAAGFARMSANGEQVVRAGLISSAPTGTPGVTSATLVRTGTGDNTIPAGTILEDSRRVKYTTDVDIPLPPGAFTLAASFHTLRLNEKVDTVDDPGLRFSPAFIVGEATNATPIRITTTTAHGLVDGDKVQVKGALGNTAANGFWTIGGGTTTGFNLVGSVGNGVYVPDTAEVFPNPFAADITSATPTMGGASNWLGALGVERGILRQELETDGGYRSRVRNIPDAVSPQAILDAADSLGQEAGWPQLLMLEPFRQGATQDLLDDIGLGHFETLYFDNTEEGTTGDPFPYSWDEIVSTMLTRREGRAYFQITPVGEPDSIRVLPVDWVGAISGYYTVGNNATVVPGAAAIYDDVNRRRAAGVQFDFIIPAIKEFYVQAVVAPAAVAWTVTPPAGYVWWLAEAIVSHVKQSAGILPADRSHVLRFTFEDATTYTTPAFFGYDSERIVYSKIYAAISDAKRITEIRGSMAGPGAVNFNLIAVLRVFEVPV